MKKLLVVALVISAFIVGFAIRGKGSNDEALLKMAEASAKTGPVTPTEIIDLKKAGLDDQAIMGLIERRSDAKPEEVKPAEAPKAEPAPAPEAKKETSAVPAPAPQITIVKEIVEVPVVVHPIYVRSLPPPRHVVVVEDRHHHHGSSIGVRFHF